jgi:hypothetical protein
VWATCTPSKKKILAWRNAGAIATDRPRTYFRLEAVFSALQVEPLPPPAEPEPLDPPIAAVQGDTLAWAVAPLEKLADELGYAVVYQPLAEGHGGSCDPNAKVLTINSDQAVNAQVDVGCHELAHALVRHDRQDDDPKLGYAEEELVAESVAHLAVSFVGLDSSASAVPYLAVWSESAAADTFERIAGLVDRLARRLEAHTRSRGSTRHPDSRSDRVTPGPGDPTDRDTDGAWNGRSRRHAARAAPVGDCHRCPSVTYRAASAARLGPSATGGRRRAADRRS